MWCFVDVLLLNMFFVCAWLAGLLLHCLFLCGSISGFVGDWIPVAAELLCSRISSVLQFSDV